MFMATGAWSTSVLLLLLLRRSWTAAMCCAAWGVNKEAPSDNAWSTCLLIGEARGCLWARAGCRLGTLANGIHCRT